ncbi:MAG TPA: shikimate dehydrogenase [Candidatus Gastranaerophilales bacterium]|nr:shikimate dehydrogenase [Candidatus Gastranaerophilales bacterium]
MIKLGIIGYPLAHSLSPTMHNAALKITGIEGDYQPLETRPEELEVKINYLKNSGFKGFNVTIPHKVCVMKYLDNIDVSATLIGAVNTVIIDQKGNLNGLNTDAYGFIKSIPEDIIGNITGKKAVILGSGGAARAVISALVALNINDIKIIARNQVKAEELINLSGKNFCGLKLKHLIPQENMDLSDCSLIVNTTPVGMQGKFEGISPLSAYSIDSLKTGAFVYDIVYRPRKTKLLELTEKRGLKTLDGLDMLVLQGAKSFSLWTGKEASVETMKNAAVAAL